MPQKMEWQGATLIFLYFIILRCLRWAPGGRDTNSRSLRLWPSAPRLAEFWGEEILG